jgi:hypothetical protein
MAEVDGLVLEDADDDDLANFHQEVLIERYALTLFWISVPIEWGRGVNFLQPTSVCE